jgi:DNA-directed RNA polymerase specialized sigma24 family protein
MFIPEGFTEDEVLKIIDDAVIPLASHFVFGYFDIDDMIQEGRKWALEALPRFDSSKGATLKTFLIIHVRNRFITMQRDKLHRQQPPCLSCAHLDNDDCELYRDKSHCLKWCSWIKRNSSKRALMETYNTSQVVEYTEAESVENKYMNSELINMISKRIPLHLRSDFLRYKDGAKLSRARIERIRKAIFKIISDEEINEQREKTWPCQ